MLYSKRLFLLSSFLFARNNLKSSQYEEHGEDFIDMLDGMFSFVLLDTRDKSFIAARDAIGITSLYMGWGLDGMFPYFGIEWTAASVTLIICTVLLLLLVWQTSIIT